MSNSSSSTSSDAAAKAELVALVVWLRTFPCYASDSRKPVTCDSVMDLLSTTSMAREIWKVAEDVCGEQDELSSSDSHTKADDIWTSLLVLTSTRARPFVQKQHDDDTALSPPRLKAYVLSGLLDCAVKTADQAQRKQYIERIMQLPKSTQKTLMGMIERRSGKSSSSSTPGSNKMPTTPATGTPAKSALKKISSNSRSTPPSASSSRLAHSTAKIYGNSSRTASSSSHHGTPPPTAAFPGSAKDTAARHQQKHSRTTSAVARPIHSNINGESPGTTSTSYSTTARRPDNNNTSTSYSTPARRPDNNNTSSKTPSSASFLSPATRESPQKLQNLVIDLRQRNEQLQNVLDNYQERQDQLQSKISNLEITKRQQLLQQETASLQRLQETKDDYDETFSQLQAQLVQAQQEAEENKAAALELRSCKDQLEEQQHQGQLLNETLEKLRRYKTKMEELHDVQTLYKREQEAHAQCVQEICRLETTVSTLEPFKRQVEEYKVRAVEAEVKLVEIQDYLSRLEQANKDQSLTNEYLWKGAILQKEQLEELQRRIQQEAASANETATSAPIAERINPELQVELARLRTENVQLRSFAEKRQEDKVTSLEQELDDCKRLGDAYKTQYLTTKSTLSQVQAELADTQQCLRTTTEELTVRAENAESQCLTLQAKVEQLTNDLKQTCDQLEQAEQRIRELEAQVQEYKTKLLASENLSSERLEKWKDAQNELDATNSELDAATKQCQKLVQEVDGHKQRNKELEELQTRLGKGLQSAQEELEDAHMQIADQTRRQKESDQKTTRLMETNSKLQNQLEDEKKAHQDAREEAHRSLEATRAVLLTQNKKQVDEVQENMNRLLDDERRANRRKDEEHKRDVFDLNNKWKNDYDEMEERWSATLQRHREESNDRVESLKKEFQAERDKSQSEYSEMKQQFTRSMQQVEQDAQARIEKTIQECQVECEKIRQEGETVRSNLIHKGRSMIEETNCKAKADLRQMDEHIRELKHLLKKTESESEDIQILLRNKITTLKDKLESSSDTNADLIREKEDVLEKLKELDRENFKLQEDNDRYRRQIGAGGFGGDGQLQAQLERIQREYNEVLLENRNLKKNRAGAGGFATIDESDDSLASSYGRGRSTISHIRREYEVRIDALNDEKRELVMKNSAAITDVQKAEQRAWEREQEVSRLKNDLTSLKLELARSEYKRDGPENKSPHHDLSFMTAEEEMRYSPTPASVLSSSVSSSHHGLGSYDNLEMPHSRSRSPSLNAAMKNRTESETKLRQRISSLTGTPPRVPNRGVSGSSSLSFGVSMPSLDSDISSGPYQTSSEKVLTPTARHENAFNSRHERFGGSPLSSELPSSRLSGSPLDKSGFGKASSASDVFGVRRSTSPTPSVRAAYDTMPSLMDTYTSYDDRHKERPNWR